MKAPQIDGILNIRKASGATSMDVVRRVKRASGQRRVGHGGTLDPQASGVLPICLGQATRMMEALIDNTKEYRATVRLGVVTDTYDTAGQVIEERDASGVSRADVEEALGSFRGVFQQTPPMYSALRREGHRLYQLARSGIEVPRAPRRVEVLRVDLVDWSPPLLTLDLECGRGLYLRSLAHDMGQLLGCGATLEGLDRLRAGPFRVEDALPLAQAEEALAQGRASDHVYPPDYVLLHLGAVSANRQEEARLAAGQPASLGLATHEADHLESRRAYSVDGRFIALVRFNRPLRLWQPYKVFQPGIPSPYAQEGARLR